jgi:hypothetical protein
MSCMHVVVCARGYYSACLDVHAMMYLLAVWVELV